MYQDNKRHYVKDKRPMDYLADLPLFSRNDERRERRCGMREVYIKKTVEILNQLDTERLKKVYTVAKTLLGFLKEKGGAA